MKKPSTGILSLCIALILVVSFSACQKQVNNLKANYHIKAGHGFYGEEKYKKAADAYDLALTFNPEQKTALFYGGTSYAQLYKPGDKSDKNIAYGEKAKEYLQKAQQGDPTNKEIIMALGDVFDKMNNFTESEKYYLELLQSDDKNPKAYYVIANFYSKYASDEQYKAKYEGTDKAVEMYEKRIALEPSNPEGYNYLASFYATALKYDLAVEQYEKMLKAIESFYTDEKQRNDELSLTHYKIGHVLWNKSYKTGPDDMAPIERKPIIQKGMDSFTKATELSPNMPEPWIYLSLMWRENLKLDNVNKAEIEKKADEYREKFMDLRKRKMAIEQTQKALEKE